MRRVRLEEIFIATGKHVTPNLWIESETLQYGETIWKDNQYWVVVEVVEILNN